VRYSERLAKRYEREVERWSLLRSQRRDAKRMCGLFPAFQNYGALRRRHEGTIKAAYEIYLREISTEDMAASLKASSFLYSLASIGRPSRILDLGSGFSSFVFRLYAKGNDRGTDVFSVDDNRAWLMKTRSFLVGQGMDGMNLFHWQEFRRSNPGTFDLIFHDLGSMELRAESLPEVLLLCRPGGMVILDDMHSESYRPLALKIVEEAGFHLFSVRKYTLDKFGRFAEIAMRAGA
jgi:predicted O-methyltransferase YrrM